MGTNQHKKAYRSTLRVRNYFRDHQDLSAMQKVAAMRDLMTELNAFYRAAANMTVEDYDDWLREHGDLDDVGGAAFRESVLVDVRNHLLDGAQVALEQIMVDRAPSATSVIGDAAPPIVREALKSIDVIDSMIDFGSSPFRFTTELCAPSVCGGPKYQISAYHR